MSGFNLLAYTMCIALRLIINCEMCRLVVCTNRLRSQSSYEDHKGTAN